MFSLSNCLKARVKGEPVYSRNGRVLGTVYGKVYVTKRTVNHFFKKFNGFGVSTNVLDHLFEKGVKWLLFEYYGKTGVLMYRVRLMDFVMKRVEYIDDSWAVPDRQFVLDVDEMELIKGVDAK